MNFRIEALAADAFAPLFNLTDAELSENQACRQIVTESPGTPCRVSLADAAVGETVVLLNHCHQPADSPYRATHAIFVRENAVQATLAKGEVPEVIRKRLISLRFFDAAHFMVDADVLPGDAVGAYLSQGFENKNIAYAHLHFAKPGCFAAAAYRAE